VGSSLAGQGPLRQGQPPLGALLLREVYRRYIQLWGEVARCAGQPPPRKTGGTRGGATYETQPAAGCRSGATPRDGPAATRPDEKRTLQKILREQKLEIIAEGNTGFDQDGNWRLIIDSSGT
jgi:hypothetical protein